MQEVHRIMKVLWITNIMLPAACQKLSIPTINGGGWMVSLAEELKLNPEIELAIATIYKGKDLLQFDANQITYFLLPSPCNNKYNSSLESLWQNIVSIFSPDIVHIHGTEMAHGLALLRACPKQKAVVSIQGLISVCERYFYGGMSFIDILKNITFRDIIRRDTLFKGRQLFRNGGILEKEYITRTKDVIGRTTWDFVHTKKINPGMNYHFCNESLRSIFYENSWDINKKQSHMIFLSQGGYPLKGMHMLLKAIALLKKEYQDIIVNVAGTDVTKFSSIKDKIKISGYGKYLRKLIADLDLSANIRFSGHVNDTQMLKMYLQAHVFVCPSSIENSPNSLGEAKLLGVPCVAAFVGGIPDMSDGALLYRYEEYEMLAYNIKQIFENNELALHLSENGKKDALKRHDRNKNVLRLLQIYNDILG
jgi:glycosyltransferase involved in cell wall biosynthesis